MPALAIKRRKRTVPQLAAEVGIDPKKIHTWIASGELRAVNLATDPHGRPRWSIDLEDWEVFERGREARPESPAKRIRRRAATTKDYFA